MPRSEDKTVLSYHDSLLRTSDINLLKGPSWLNDAIIGFYFEYLEQTSEVTATKNIKLYGPELTQLLKMTEEYSFLSPDVDYMFFPLNDCNNYEDVGGSHWSLLVYSKNEKICCHFDSSAGGNNSVARNFSNKIIKHLVADTETEFKNVPCPQQGNSYDCGIYVLCFADIILEHLKSNSRIGDCDLSKISSRVKNKRNELLDLIDKLSKQS
ncbi:sentrin-specific protease 8 [Microplitis demolitor]|uniref:sentrin-specific protease 8 n=1 Tax=Microplitis demolitor TaxID=69319 RepID=UPI0004CDAFA2|nr:sentrin-specific protease 8 [Microplitis demolitor]